LTIPVSERCDLCLCKWHDDYWDDVRAEANQEDPTKYGSISWNRNLLIEQVPPQDCRAEKVPHKSDTEWAEDWECNLDEHKGEAPGQTEQ